MCAPRSASTPAALPSRPFLTFQNIARISTQALAQVVKAANVLGKERARGATAESTSWREW